MNEAIIILQKEVYMLDFRIGTTASELARESATDKTKDLDWYNECCYKRSVLLNVIEKLKEIL